MQTTGDVKKNKLLAALPEFVLQRWLPSLERIQVPLGQVVYEPGARLSHIYFPVTALVSLLCLVESGAATEIAAVGSEGVVGTSVFMSGDGTPSRAVVQSPGILFRMKASIAKEEFDRRMEVTRLFLRYTQALMIQVAQTAACNRHHSLDKQLCRWLLTNLDHLGGSEVRMTHEMFANTHGVRRGSVTEAAARLQGAGLIRYSRGHITVLDRAGLEKRTCECYAVVKKEYARLLGNPAI